MSRPEGFFIDFDDTLVQTTRVRRPLLEGELARRGATPEQLALVGRRWGSPFDELVAGIVSDREMGDFLSAYLRKMKDVEPRAAPGAQSFLDRAAATSTSVYVVTSSLRELVEHDLAELDFTVSGIFGAGDTKHHKPDGRVFDEIAAALDISNENLRGWCFVGDSISDARAASERLPFIAVTSGITSKSEFEGFGVANDSIVSSLDEITKRFFGS